MDDGRTGSPSPLLGVTSRTGQAVVVSVVSILVIVYVLVGGMKGTTRVQIVKGVVLIAGAFAMSALVQARYGFDFSALLGDVTARGGEDMPAPGKQYGATSLSRVDFLSLGLTLVPGTAGLPHVLVRFYTVPSAQEARRSVLWAIGLIGGFLWRSAP